ncbi:hypothetical protein SAMN05421858_2124 [Haladaptatus litoreus]|uniref:Uncharacterized protein n=1 Tax=Haladaptatus litoreus TaxID=553468 RepID=A0A1N6ZQH4_9EURY|nr:hypothetical protein [Haladaptatus litoreus]SIR29045.1 hypothetical protein SAMN05421858_2124 [Haladaptatus litoreus]
MSKLRFDATTATKAFTAILLVVALVSVVGLVSEQGVGGMLEGLAILYLVGVLFIGVFRDITQIARWRAAFFGGVVVWSLTNYFVAGGDQFSLLLGVAGSVMLVLLGYRYMQAGK